MTQLVVIISAALIMELIFGDPAVSFHPVALMGRSALQLEKPFRARFKNEFAAGMLCAVSVILFFALAAGLLTALASRAGNMAGNLAAAFFLYTAIAPKSLCEHARQVYRELCSGNLAAARKKVSMLVSRDPAALDQSGIIRSCLESMGENVSDGVTAPLFFAAAGWLAGGAPGCAAAVWFYRCANTLDATFGYLNRRYRRFGTFAARLDDLLNFLPARLTPVAIAAAAALSGKYPWRALLCAWRDHGKHPSPNSAWGMASLAGALGVRLGGKTRYAGNEWRDYPFWGDNLEPLAATHIIISCRLILWTTIFFSLFTLAATALILYFTERIL